MNSQHRSFQTLRFMLISAVLLMFTSVLHGQMETPDTNFELVSEVTSVAEGETFSIALHLEPKAGWHIYWVNAGERDFLDRPTLRTQSRVAHLLGQRRRRRLRTTHT